MKTIHSINKQASIERSPLTPYGVFLLEDYTRYGKRKLRNRINKIKTYEIKVNEVIHMFIKYPQDQHFKDNWIPIQFICIEKLLSEEAHTT